MAAPDGVERTLAGLEPTLRRTFVARYGVDIGCEVTPEAMAWAWEHADVLATVRNPGGYLYRVGQTAAKRLHRWQRRPVSFPAEPAWTDAPELTGDVFRELARLKPDERVAVLLVHGYGFRYREVAELLGISTAAVTNHVHRGLKKLRTRLEDTP